MIRRPVSLLASGLTAAALVLSTAPSWAADLTGPAERAGSTAGLTAASALAAPAATPAAEARRVDRVRTPKPDWWNCSVLFGAGECATVELPLDYDRPNGAKTSVAVLRVPAKDQKNKIGTLFLNPGGPGGSGVLFAADASYFASEEILAKFDIVGFDPRGTNFSDNVQCWENLGEQAADLEGFDVAFPLSKEETSAYVASSERFGQACSTRGKPLSGSMSTAEVARDMDVLRRMVGDKKLSYLGFSYGSYLGQVYANLFPDRFRAVAIDGVLDPVAWAGTEDGTEVPQTARLRSGDGAQKALAEILERCGEAGEEYCNLAQRGDPEVIYGEILQELRKNPLEIVDPETGEVLDRLTYATLFSFLLFDLYIPEASLLIDLDLSYVWDLLQGEGQEGSEQAARFSAARAGLATKVKAVRTQEEVQAAATQSQAGAGFGFPYHNDLEAFQSVTCTDSRNPAEAAGWSKFAADAAKRGSGFGRLWTWASAPCASDTWTVKDEDGYRGPFTRRTAKPVLVVGNYWDPATNYAGAVAAAELLPNSRLLKSDNWGHTAYGTSACATDAINQYLLKGTLPAEGTECIGDYQPFTEPLEEEPEEEVPSVVEDLEERSTARSAGPESSGGRGVPDRLPPVVPPLPGSGPRF